MVHHHGVAGVRGFENARAVEGSVRKTPTSGWCHSATCRHASSANSRRRPLRMKCIRHMPRSPAHRGFVRVPCPYAGRDRRRDVPVRELRRRVRLLPYSEHCSRNRLYERSRASSQGSGGAGRLWHALLRGIVLVTSYLAIRTWPIAGPIAAIVIGHSLACWRLSRTRSRQRRDPQSPVRNACSRSCHSASRSRRRWNRLHNDAHHGHANTVDGPRPSVHRRRREHHDQHAPRRRCRRSGPGAVTRSSCTSSRIARHIVTVFYRGEDTPAIVTRQRTPPAPRAADDRRRAIAYRGDERRLILPRSWLGYLGPHLALCLASAVIMSYVFTNHFLNPISHEHDPLADHVRARAGVDRPAGHFSFHTEHHAFRR